MNKKIPDSEIPTADNTELIMQYQNLVFKIANRYYPVVQAQGYAGIDDLIQAGYIGLLTAKDKYESSVCSNFIYLAYFYINREIKKALGFTGSGYNEKPILPIYADAPLDPETEETLLDMIADESIEDNDDIVERNERAEAVHEAVNRLCDSQKEIINLHYFQNKELSEISQITGLPVRKVSTTQYTGIQKMKNDQRLKKRIYADDDPYSVHVGVNRFNSTWTSATEIGVLKLEKQDIQKRKWEESTKKKSKQEIVAEQIAKLKSTF